MRNTTLWWFRSSWCLSVPFNATAYPRDGGFCVETLWKLISWGWGAAGWNPPWATAPMLLGVLAGLLLQQHQFCGLCCPSWLLWDGAAQERELLLCPEPLFGQTLKETQTHKAIKLNSSPFKLSLWHAPVPWKKQMPISSLAVFSFWSHMSCYTC